MSHFVAALLLTAAAPSADVAVVCHPELQPAIRPWVAHRVQQGHRVALVASGDSAPAIRREIRKLAAGGTLRYVLLVGDSAGDAAPKSERAFTVAAPAVEARVITKWGPDRDIASDNWYADLDDDHLPDVAIGRLPVDSVAELSTIVAKILSYEKRAGFGAWRRQIDLISGVSGFGPLVDNVVESAARRVLVDGLPATCATTITSGNWRSAFCPHPRAFSLIARRRLESGSLFWVYMGHGQRDSLDVVPTPLGNYRVLEKSKLAARLPSERGAIAVLMACYTGAFDGAEDCLAEAMLHQPGGPVAAVCASRVTMPYGMAVLGSEMLHVHFREQPATLGDTLLIAKRRAAEAGKLNPSRKMLDQFASAFGMAGDDLAKERLEHIQLFNLLGDPLLRMRHPAKAEVDTAGTIPPGSRLEVAVTSPIAGQCTVELFSATTQTDVRPASRSQYDGTKAAVVEYHRAYLQANNRRHAAAAQVIDAGSTHFSLTVPAACDGPCHVRVFIEGRDSFAVGAAEVTVGTP